MEKRTLAELNNDSSVEFSGFLGGIFEHSAWVAEAAERARPFKSLGELHNAMVSAVDQAGEPKQLELIRAHPDLVGRLAREGRLTRESTSEQAAAGLSDLSETEITAFERYNSEYREKFGFPFVICARLNRKEAILQAMPERLKNEPDSERKTALGEIAKIAQLRLRDAVKTGKLTTHVLDTAAGKPAAGIPIFLRTESGEILKQVVTNADGRVDAPLLEFEDFAAGTYCLGFHVSSYFPDGFYDIIPMRIRITDAAAHYHVPLLFSPFAYSTYRGS